MAADNKGKWQTEAKASRWLKRVHARMKRGTLLISHIIVAAVVSTLTWGVMEWKRVEANKVLIYRRMALEEIVGVYESKGILRGDLDLSTEIPRDGGQSLSVSIQSQGLKQVRFIIIEESGGRVYFVYTLVPEFAILGGGGI